MTTFPSSMFSRSMFISVFLLALRICESSVVRTLNGCGLLNSTPISPNISPADAFPQTWKV